MARHSLPKFSALWQKHEALYVTIFSIALNQLNREKIKSKNEDHISEQLSLILSDICYRESQSRNIEIRTPNWENPIQPVIPNELRGGRRNKIPDFTCKCCNPFASRSDQYEISLHIECKCLGLPSGEKRNYILNKNYINEGMKRFLSETHGYGRRADSGIMIGYIISMQLELIAQDVNNYQSIEFPNHPALSFCFENPPVFIESQNINRKKIVPHNFKLVHMWVDLRNRIL